MHIGIAIGLFIVSYSKILYSQARLISGLTVENPVELSELICNMMLE